MLEGESWFFFQTQHGMYANKCWGAAYTHIGPRSGYPITGANTPTAAWATAGASQRIDTNDMYAVDYPLGKGDVIFSPFIKRGTVTFAGRNYTHKDYGIFVSIKADNGRT